MAEGYRLSREAIVKINEVEGIPRETTEAVFAKLDAWAAEGLSNDQIRDRIMQEAGNRIIREALGG